MPLHEIYMRRCLELAQLGLGNVSPNPMVGAVIVHNDNIIGEGYHQKYGGPHAEVNAINQVINNFSNYAELLRQSTIYVSLEPCAHYGKTPPCADLIIKHQVPKVVVGCRDPFEQVVAVYHEPESITGTAPKRDSRSGVMHTFTYRAEPFMG